MMSILLPDFRKSLVCSSMDAEVSTAAGCFFFAAARVGLRAMRIPYAMNERRTIVQEYRQKYREISGALV
jgi:hypothetical protein